MQKLLFFLVFSALVSCSRTIHVADTKVAGYEMDARSAAPDQRIDAIIAPYKLELDKEMEQVIGEVAVRMEKKKPESTLGNWVADVIHVMASKHSGGSKIDFAIQNYGGIRIGSISPGPVTAGKVFELMPFDNLISILEMPGVMVDSLVHRFALAGGWPVSGGLRFRIRGGQAVDVTIDGEPFDQDRTYRVAMPDYVANGGDRMDFLKGLPRTDLDYLIRDALIDFIRAETLEGRAVEGKLDGRIVSLDD